MNRQTKQKHTSQRCLFLAAAAGLHFDFFEPEFISWSQCSAPHTSAKHRLSFWIETIISFQLLMLQHDKPNRENYQNFQKV